MLLLSSILHLFLLSVRQIVRSEDLTCHGDLLDILHYNVKS